MGIQIVSGGNRDRKWLGDAGLQALAEEPPGPASRVGVGSGRSLVTGDSGLGRTCPGTRTQISDTRRGRPSAGPHPPDPDGSQGEPLRLEGAGGSAAPLPGDARRPPGDDPGTFPAPRSPRTVSWLGSGPGGSLRGGGPRGSQAPPGPARGGLAAALCYPPRLAPGVSARVFSIN